MGIRTPTITTTIPTTTTTSSRLILLALVAFLWLLPTHVHAKATFVGNDASTTTRATAATTIEAVPDDTQLSSKGSQAGCDHYRNGYMGLAMCVNFYDDSADGTSK